MTDLDSSTGTTHCPAALRWLRTALWAADVEVDFLLGSEGDQVFLAEPSAADPELLVPTEPPTAVAAVSRRSSDARSLGGRVRNAAVEAAGRTGMLPRLAPGRLLSLRVGRGADDPVKALPAKLGAVLGLEDLVYAVTLGRERYNRKPVLTVLDPAGRLVAFAKIGADEVTDRGVDNESRWLSLIGERSPAAFGAPSIVWSGRWRGHPLLVTRPVHPPRLPARRSIARPPGGLVESIAALDPRPTVTVAGTAVVGAIDLIADDRLTAARAGVLDRHGTTEIRVGPWHGDLSPWNVASRRRRPPLVWDWEAAAPARPVGADRLHWIVMVATHLRGRSPAAAVRALAAADVAEHQDHAAARSAALDLYLLDVARRDLEIVAAGVEPGLLPGIGRAALDRLVGS